MSAKLRPVNLPLLGGRAENCAGANQPNTGAVEYTVPLSGEARNYDEIFTFRFKLLTTAYLLHLQVNQYKPLDTFTKQRWNTFKYSFHAFPLGNNQALCLNIIERLS